MFTGQQNRVKMHTFRKKDICFTLPYSSKKKMKAITYQGQMKSPTSFTFILIGWFELFSAIFVCIYVCMYVFSVTRKKESIHLKSKLSLNLKNYL